ncbi:MAG: hypothetical protein NXH75_18365, partial [Halobacteriovoraceae bacterium]|nr:hypothetical protein [Halobacteriovoraceae bacterium]
MTDNFVKGATEFLPVIPVIESTEISLQGSSWKIDFYQEFSQVILKSKEELEKKLSIHTKEKFNSHRVQIIINGIPLLFGIYSEEKTIGVYSPRLGRELFLLEQIQINKDKEPCKSFVLTDEYKNFKNYAEKVASLSLKEFPSQHDLITSQHGLPDLVGDTFYQELENDIHEKTQELVKYLNTYKASWFEKVSDFGLDLTARFALMRVHLLKFLAILPSLDHDEDGDEVKRILLETFRRLVTDSTKAKLLRKKGQEAPLPQYLIYALRAGSFVFNLIPAKPLSTFIRSSVKVMAKRFIAGENIQSVEQTFSGLFQTGRDVTLDQLGELVVSEKEADNYCREVISLIDGFGLHVTKGAQNAAGINRAHVSIKVSALCSDFKPSAPEHT